MSKTFIIVFTGLLMSMSAFSIDIVLPVLHPMAADLSVSLPTVQLTLILYTLSFGFGQLFMGSISDRFGRRPTLLVGMGLYMAGAVLGAAGPTIEMVLAGRMLQGFGGAAGHVVARAVLRDLYDGRKLARAMALSTAVFAVGPIIGPLMGAGLLILGHWRLVFLAMALFALMLVWCVVFLYRETLTTPDPRALRPARFAAGIGQIVRHPQSRFYVVVSAVTFITIISYVVNSSRLFIEGLGMSEMGFAIVFALTGLGIVVGQYANSAIIRRRGVEVAVWVAALGLLAVMASLSLFIAAGLFTVLVFALHTFAYFICFQTIYANGASLTLDPHKDIAGLASSFFGFSAQFTGTVAFVVLGLQYDGSPLRWALGMLAISVATVLLLVGRAAVGAYRRQNLPAN